MYLRNTWYVAAWDSEVTRDPRQIKILGEKFVTYRTEAGDPVALLDACPHRKLPLSKGRTKSDLCPPTNQVVGKDEEKPWSGCGLRVMRLT